MTIFRLDPAVIARLTAKARPGAPMMPHGGPILLDADGCAWLPTPGGGEGSVGVYVHPGLRVAFVPVAEADGLLLIQWGGPGAEPGFEEEGLTAFLTRAGLRALIGDLQEISAGLDGEWA